MDLEKLPHLAKNAEPANSLFFKRLKKNVPKNLDAVVHELDKETFEKINCTQCANCCKTTSPIFYQKDIERLSKHFRIKPSRFIENYLIIDEEKDYVLKSAPCPFLGDDNHCSVYDDRPAACKEYPHTQRKRFYQLFDLTLKNTAICPVVYEIVEKLKKKYSIGI